MARINSKRGGVVASNPVAGEYYNYNTTSDSCMLTFHTALEGSDLWKEFAKPQQEREVTTNLCQTVAAHRGHSWHNHICCCSGEPATASGQLVEI